MKHKITMQNFDILGNFVVSCAVGGAVFGTSLLGAPLGTILGGFLGGYAGYNHAQGCR